MTRKLIAPLPLMAVAAVAASMAATEPAAAAKASCGNAGGILYYANTDDANTDGSAVALDMQGNELSTL